MGRRYAREKLTEQLVRLMERASTPDPNRPFEVSAVYVYGSYARGALECGDIDMWLYVHHVDDVFLHRCIQEQWSGRRRGAFDVEVRKHLGLTRSHIHAQISRAQDPAADVAQWMGCMEDQTLRVIFDGAHPDWRANIEAITPDSTAGRHARATDAIISLLRTSDTKGDMEKVMGLIEAGHLTLERKPVPADAGLDPWFRSRIDSLVSGSGKELAKLWPHAYRWLLDKRSAAFDVVQRTRMVEIRYGRDRTPRPPRFMALLGKPSFSDAAWMLHGRPELREVMLLAHLSSDQPNEIFVMSRGPNWIKNKKARDEHLHEVWHPGVRPATDEDFLRWAQQAADPPRR